MIIVFFHVLYLIGKVVYKRYQNNRLMETKENEEKSCLPVIANVPNKSDNKDPLEPYDDEDCPKAPRFSPPAYIQRYLAVANVLVNPCYQEKIKKVVDFGCSELGFLTYLKHTPGIEEILCVDIDRDTLEHHQHKALPLNADYLQNRQHSLTIRVYEGSVTHRDNILANSDAVIAIELIEHLYPDTLMDFPYNIFGFIKPKVAVVTTPNADFNVLFPSMNSRFRHWDHKFEWTREQFQDWAKNIICRYPEYDVTFEGIGAGPAGTEKLGCCSQMAIFNKIRTINTEMINGIEGLLKTVTSQEFPYRVDNRSDEEKILDEASYYIRNFTHTNPEYSEEYPLDSLMKNLENFFITSETLREILTNGGWSIIDRSAGPMILCPALSTFSDYDDEIEDDIDVDDSHDSISQPNYENGFGTWGEDDIEAAYEENWDDDYDIPVVLLSSNEESSNRVDSIGAMPQIEFTVSRNMDIDSFDSIEVLNVSNVPSSFEAVDRLSTFQEPPESDEYVSENVDVYEENVESPDSTSQGQDSNAQIKRCGVSEEVGTSKRIKIIEDTEIVGELSSLCSIYLESSRNDERDPCPTNITDPSFDCTELQRSFDNSMETSSRTVDSSTSRQFPTKRLSTSPRFSSSPKTHLSEHDATSSSNHLKSTSDCSLQSCSSVTTSNSSTSFRTVKRWYPSEVNEMYRMKDEGRLKGGNEFADVIGDDATLESEDSCESLTEDDSNHRTLLAERQKTPGSLSIRPVTSFEEARGTLKFVDTRSSLEKIAIKDERLINDFHCSAFEEKSGSSKTEESSAIAEGKPISPETPPNSWSPEIMDSGYPNSASIQDTTPEYDLSSIAQDRISDSESPSIAEVPRPGFVEHGEVENGDLANNNRDGEGNNVMAAGMIENEMEDDLQPLIDVLENDIENENDIYALENDFPIWLLRILERGNVAGRQPIPEVRDPDAVLPIHVHAAGDAGMPDLDEGFDSTSSENNESQEDEDDEEDDDDDDENIDEISMESSEEAINWNVSGDHC